MQSAAMPAIPILTSLVIYFMMYFIYFFVFKFSDGSIYVYFPAVLKGYDESILEFCRN